MTLPAPTDQARPRLAILSYSSGDFDARSLRLARSAADAGYDVTMYARWHSGQAQFEELDGFRLIRASNDWRLAVPLLRRWVRRRSSPHLAAAVTSGAEDDTISEPRAPDGRGWRRSWPLAPVRLVVRKLRHWRGVVLLFPLRPMGWAVALDDVVEPADLWHGMWAGSLPALRRFSRQYGGRALYDSRDVYMLSRDFARLEWPIKPLLAAAERHWARTADRVLTVNESYADLIATQLGVARPVVVLNCPNRWVPPVPPPDRIRAATGASASTFVALYQGQLTTERGIEAAMDAILQVPGAVLALLGFGGREALFRRLAVSQPYAGRVFVLPAVSPAELLEWTASADVMVMPIQPTTINHQYTTPQKLWESIAAGVPVVASDMPGMAEVVRSADVGVLCDPTDVASIAASIRAVIERPADERANLRGHVLRVAHQRYNWESQLAVLFEVYEQLGVPPALRGRASAAPGSREAEVAGESMRSAVAAPLPTTPGPRLRFVPKAMTLTPEASVDTTLVVLDTVWTPTVEDAATAPVLLRDTVESILRERDLISEAATALDDWAETSGIAGLMAHDGVSFWYGARLGHWRWLLDEMLWIAVVDRLLEDHRGIRVLALDAGVDARLQAAAHRVAERDGLTFESERPVTNPPRPAAAAPSSATAETSARREGRRRSFVSRLKSRLLPSQLERRRNAVLRRVAAIERDPSRRLLAVRAHALQRVETASGPRLINVYLDPILDRLRGTRLEPFEVDIRAPIHDDSESVQAAGPAQRVLPGDVLHMVALGLSTDAERARAAQLAATVAALDTPLVVAGMDLGPALAARVADRVARTHARRIIDVARIRILLRRLRPAGILIADEYHRQDWLGAAAAERVPVAAVQHGVIYRWHTGYMHRTRPAELRLPDRTFVFGRWEHDLLTATSVYEPDEVLVGGSPRLDLVHQERVDVAGVRAELGVADGDRLVVLSGTWGEMDRRFHYPIALARLFARPIARVHLVVKLHPSEQDEGPYRRIVEGLAAAGGFAPPPITVVRDVDLYRLLAAADAHLGIHSTVLTEAVVTATPNLLAAGLAAADLLGYVDAGVAIPVANTEDLMSALDRPRHEAMDPDRRRAFLDAHFEPGSASDRIAETLLGWLR